MKFYSEHVYAVTGELGSSFPYAQNRNNRSEILIRTTANGINADPRDLADLLNRYKKQHQLRI